MSTLQDYEKTKFVEVEPKAWKPAKEGDQIIGVLISREPRIGDSSAKYFLETKEQGKVLVWGSTILDERLALVKDTSVVRITFKEKKALPKGKSLNIYKVEVAE